MQMVVLFAVQMHIRGDKMAIHHGGKIGKAGKALATKSSSKSAKSKAGRTLAKHKADKH